MDTPSPEALRPPGPHGQGPRRRVSSDPQSCLHGAPFPKAAAGLDVADPCSELQTSLLLLLNSTDAPSFLKVRRFRVRN